MNLLRNAQAPVLGPAFALGGVQAGRPFQVRLTNPGTAAVAVLTSVDGNNFLVQGVVRLSAANPAGSLNVVAPARYARAEVLSISGVGATVCADILEGLPSRPTDRASSTVRLPIRLATMGDSLADSCSLPISDLTSLSYATANNGFLRSRGHAHNLPFVSGGKIQPVANCGIGGTVTSTMVTRDLSPASATRKGMADAANVGADVCLVSGIRNNILQNVRANTSQSTIDGLLAAGYADIEALMRRAHALGMYPILRQLGGFAYADSTVNYAKGANMTPADVAVCVRAINQAARYYEEVLFPSLGFGGLLDFRPLTVDLATGAWLPGLSIDDLHEGPEGARIINGMRAQHILEWAGYPEHNGPYAPPHPRARPGNAFASPLMLNPVNGLVPGIAVSAGSGTYTRAVSVVDVAGSPRQQIAITPQTFDGTVRVNAPLGMQNTVIAITLPIIGATPAVQVAAGDMVQYEFDLEVDDGAGGPALNVLTYGVTATIRWPVDSVSTAFKFAQVEENPNSVNLLPQQSVLSGKIVSLPMVAPANSADMTLALVNVSLFACSTATYRVRIGSLKISVIKP